jgi:ABC-type Zn2+ transport system substrate-binding protein/surface adhesin
MKSDFANESAIVDIAELEETDCRVDPIPDLDRDDDDDDDDDDDEDEDDDDDDDDDDDIAEKGTVTPAAVADCARNTGLTEKLTAAAAAAAADDDECDPCSVLAGVPLPLYPDPLPLTAPAAPAVALYI